MDGMKGCKVNESPTFIRIQSNNGSTNPLIPQATIHLLHASPRAPVVNRQLNTTVAATSEMLIAELKMKGQRHIHQRSAITLCRPMWRDQPFIATFSEPRRGPQVDCLTNAIRRAPHHGPDATAVLPLAAILSSGPW